ncbi:ROK family protein [Chitinophaga lutea]
MKVLAIDLGGTKMAAAVFGREGDVLHERTDALDGRTGGAVGAMIASAVREMRDDVQAVGIAVPGISRQQAGTVWAPNIPGWEDYPLLREAQEAAGDIPVYIESDRSCYILGETWKGNAAGCRDAIFLAVGTGIGAGILTDGRLLHGAADIGGAIGWMALERPYRDGFTSCGCFESRASGEGIARTAAAMAAANHYDGPLKNTLPTAAEVFEAYAAQDRIAVSVIRQAVELWGMATANLVSLFNPEKIIFGGGVFGPAVTFLPDIAQEAARWAQPISMRQVRLEASALGNRAGLYGAAFLAFFHQSGKPYVQ